jgi:fructokinase
MLENVSNYDVACYGEILWDLLPDKSLPGGAPMNVAYHLKKLGTNPALITRIGLDDYGKRLVDILSTSGLSSDFFQMDYDHSTGLVYAKPNEHNEVVYDIVFPSAWDFIEWNQTISDVVKSAEFFVYGSLTSRSKASRDTLYQLIDVAKTKVLDINLRPPHFSRSGVEYLLSNTDILKVNKAELELITGWFSQYDSIEDRIKILQDQFKIETIIVTLGGNGSVVNKSGKTYYDNGYTVQVADTIGSGDAFLAGFLHQQLNGTSIADSLSFASKLGALIATYHGACPDYQPTEINTVVSNNALTNIQSTQ